MGEIMAMSKLDPAYGIIRKFDTNKQRGTEVLANRLGVNRSAVIRWTLARERGGTGGYIPPRYYDEILSFAREIAVTLHPAEFVVGSRAPSLNAGGRREPLAGSGVSFQSGVTAGGAARVVG